MAYENVDVGSAKTAINQLKSSINYNSSKQILNDLGSNESWSANSKNNLKNAINTLINTRYKDLENYLEKCMTNLSKIESVKQMQAQNASYEGQINSKRTEYNNAKRQYDSMPDKSTPEAIRLKTKIDQLNRDINNLQNEKNKNGSNLASAQNGIDI